MDEFEKDFENGIDYYLNSCSMDNTWSEKPVL